MKLSDKIRILRKARGLSQEQFGYSLSEATAGVTRQTVSDWENGKFEPKLDNIRDIAKVLGVSFDVLLDESVDLNDAEVLKNILSNAKSNESQDKEIKSSVDMQKDISTRTRYDIRLYKLDKKNYVKLAIHIAILTVFVIFLILFIVGLTLSSDVLYIIGAILGIIFFIPTPTAIFRIKSFVRDYKNPWGASFGEINNTHLIIYAQQIGSNVVGIPLEKIKDIRLGDNATKRHGDLVILIDGREKPITMHNVAVPQEVIKFYEQLQKLDASDDLVKII